jgi:hypothetical protein
MAENASGDASSVDGLSSFSQALKNHVRESLHLLISHQDLAGIITTARHPITIDISHRYIERATS